MRALVLAPYSLNQLKRLQESVEVTHESWLDTRRLYDPDELASRIRSENMAILVIEADFVFEEVFQQAEHLKFVGICRNATHHIDLEAASQQGVLVVNTPSRNSQAVAEHALGLMLSLARKIPQVHQYVKDRLWQNPVEPYISLRGVELAGRTLGVVGLGAIGRKLAEMALALGMQVIAYDPYVQDTLLKLTLVELDNLMSHADFVSIHVPLTPETQGLLDDRRLSLMKPTAYLINVSDASVLDEQTLIPMLRDRKIAGAAFDVFETHPVVQNHPLLSLDNVVLTPHIGGATEETIERHSRMMTDDILRFVDGNRPLNLVNPEVWKSSDRE
jgi:D-3-phosphoglycerate dehydrogenase